MEKIITICSLFTIFFFNGVGQTIQFTEHKLYQASSRIFFVTAADLDKDGDQDILYTQPDQDTLQWFENQGGGNFIHRNIGIFAQAFSVWMVDFDSDGDNDLLASSYDPSKVILFENDGNLNFILHLLSTEVPHPLTIAAKDIDGDGDYDISCATQDAGKGMMLLRNDGNLTFTPMDLSTQPYTSTWTEITDLDHDGDLDILGNHFQANGGILWYEQTAPLVFTEHLIPYPWTHGFTAADIDGDGDDDLAAVTCGSQIAWFQNDGNMNFTNIPIGSGFSCAVAITAADLNLDQETDLVATAWSASKVAWWENDGNENFSMQSVSDSLIKPNGVAVADLNNDSLPDIVSGGYSGGLFWWENQGDGVGITGKKNEDFATVTFNQTTRKLNIKLRPGIISVVIEMMDIHGKMLIIQDSPSSSSSIHCNGLRSGLYLVRIKSNDQTMIKKIMINPLR